MKAILIVLAVLLFAPISYAAETGRYQAIHISKPSSSTTGTNEVFIIDTQEGHIWVWTEYVTIPSVQQGGRMITYMGRVKAGQKIGDIIQQQQFK